MSYIKQYFGQLTFLLACVFSSNTFTFAQNTDENTQNSSYLAQQLPPYSERPITQEIFYFVLPDRFYNGDPSNDLGSNDKPISRGGFDPTHKGAYHGGDLAGLTQQLPYIANMGVTAIWLTPILRNQAVQGDVSGYHGYWVLDFTEIDPHLGSNDDLTRFINAAHQLNIKVFFDIITNHTADVIKYRECHDKKANIAVKENMPCPYKSKQQLALGDKYTPYIPQGQEHIKQPEWLNDPRYYHNQGDSTFEGENSLYGDFAGLDDLNTDDPQVVQGMIDIYQQIIKKFRPDGFRIDTVKHVNIEFWQQFSPALMQYAQQLGIKNFFMFGEVYSFDPKLLSYYTTIGKLPSVLDFAFQGAVQQVLVEQHPVSVLANVFNQDNLYQQSPFSANELLTFIGNHDMGRMGWFLQQSQHHYTAEQQLARSILAHAMLFFHRGVPVIYYGDEQGFTGDGGDQDSRQDMMPSQVASYNDDQLIGTQATTAQNNFNPHHPIYLSIQQFARLYSQYPALQHGKQTIKYQNSDGLWVIERSTDTQTITIAFNLGNQPIELTDKLQQNTGIKNKQLIYKLKSNVLEKLEINDFMLFINQ
jgi:glycosidase